MELDGLVVIGGDDSNTNAAVLAEYFLAKGANSLVPYQQIWCRAQHLQRHHSALFASTPATEVWPGVALRA